MVGNTDDGGGWHRNRSRLVAWSAAAVILLIPLIAMQVTDEVAWDALDFAIFGALLIGVGVGYELAAKQTGNAAYRCAVVVALAAAFILVWVNLAVGIIGTESDDANLMFGGVLAVGIIGAFIARFQPHGMTRALFATAFAQVLVGVITLIAGFGSAYPTGPRNILMATGFFAGLWILSAWLIRNAAREQLLARAHHIKREASP